MNMEYTDLCCICLKKLGDMNTITFWCGHKCVHASCFIPKGSYNCPICKVGIIPLPSNNVYEWVWNPDRCKEELEIVDAHPTKCVSVRENCSKLGKYHGYCEIHLHEV